MDPDFHLHTAWLAQVSKPAGASANKQTPQGGNTSASTRSLELVDRVAEQDDALTLGSGLWRRSAVVGIWLMGFILALALPLVIGITRHLSLPEN
jgi:hypothetical protein